MLLIILAPWVAIGFSLLGRDDLQRAQRAAISFAVVVGVGLVGGLLGDPSLAGAFAVGVLGLVPGIVCFVLARRKLTRWRLWALVVLGALIAFVALVSSGWTLVLASWANSLEEYLIAQASLQLPMLGSAALGAGLTTWSYRARAIAEA